MSPFNESRYRELLEGLEINEIMFSQMVLNNETLRFDSEFFHKEYFSIQKVLARHNLSRLGDITSWVTQGPNPVFCEASDTSIPCLTGRNINKGRVNYTGADNLSTHEYEMQKRFQLQEGDTLVTLKGLGSIGKIGYVTDNKPAIFSRDIGIIRPKGIDSAYLNAFILSKFGQKLIARGETGGTGQRTLTTSYLKSLLIPRLDIEKSIGEIVNHSELVYEKALMKYSQAESLLLSALNLTDYTPDRSNTNIKSFSESFGSSGRLDAEYYQPKYDELEGLIQSNGVYWRTIAQIETYNERGMGATYIDGGDIDMITQKHILETGLDYDNFDKTNKKLYPPVESAFVHQNDILIYGTGANIGRTQAYLAEKTAVACQDIIILRVTEDPVYVAFVMNSMIGRMQSDKMRTGSAQPHLYPKDISQFMIPFVEKSIQQQIRENIIESLALKRYSSELLETAKRAVEIAIEESESSALAFIGERGR